MFSKLIKTLFLVKEIVSKEGELHFRRYRLLSTPWFNIYIHQILKSDEDAHFHDHPWNFHSYLLKGSYLEQASYPGDWSEKFSYTYFAGDWVHHDAVDAHSLTLMTDQVWTLVFTSGRERVWGYRMNDGSWTDFKTYRKMKNEGKLK